MEEKRFDEDEIMETYQEEYSEVVEKKGILDKPKAAFKKVGDMKVKDVVKGIALTTVITAIGAAVVGCVKNHLDKKTAEDNWEFVPGEFEIRKCEEESEEA